jgi:outer membrane immunogenic protein
LFPIAVVIERPGRNNTMRRFAMLLLSAVAFAGLTAEVEAKKRVVTKAQPITKAPPPAPSGTTGFYVGINGGYGWNRATFASTAAETSINLSSGMIGPTFGYNAQSGSLVYGIETDIDYVWGKNTSWSAAPCFGCDVRLSYFGTLRGRLGYAVGEALPYFTGGLAYGGVKVGPVGGAKDTDTQAGWTVGGGVEYALTATWSLKAEYLYFDLGRAGCDITVCGAPAVDVKVRGNLARIGTNFRF